MLGIGARGSATIVLVLTLLCSALTGAAQTASRSWAADNGNGTYSNPLFYDEFSDPDIIRVGSEYYLTGTTMHTMPGLPILHSRDLVNWRIIAYAFDRLDLGPDFRLEGGRQIYGQGIWAPCFRYHNGYALAEYDHITGKTVREPVSGPHIWLRVHCNFDTEIAKFNYSANGKDYKPIGPDFTTVFQLRTFQGVRYALFNYNTGGAPGGPGPLPFDRQANGLVVTLPSTKPNEYAYVLKIRPE